MAIDGILDIPGHPRHGPAQRRGDEIDIQGQLPRIRRQPAGGSGRRRLRADVGDLAVLKSRDAEAPLATLATLCGPVFAEIVLRVRMDGGDGRGDCLTITLANCVLRDCRAEGGRPGDPAGVQPRMVDIEFETMTVGRPARAEDRATPAAGAAP